MKIQNSNQSTNLDRDSKSRAKERRGSSPLQGIILRMGPTQFFYTSKKSNESSQ